MIIGLCYFGTALWHVARIILSPGRDTRVFCLPSGTVRWQGPVLVHSLGARCSSDPKIYTCARHFAGVLAAPLVHTAS